MMALGRNHMSPSLVLNWMKSLMVGLLSAARFAIRFLPALRWAGGSSGRGLWGDCRHRAVDGSSHSARRDANAVVTACPMAALLPCDRLLPCPRIRAHALSVLRAGPRGAGLLASSCRTPLASGRCFAEGSSLWRERLGLWTSYYARRALFFFDLRVGMGISSLRS